MSSDLRRATERILLVTLPLLLIAHQLWLLIAEHNLAVDFQGVYWQAGRRVLLGLSPYTLPVVHAFKYPAPAALLFAPFALLPREVAGVVGTAMALAAVPATLRVLNVRDWRVYAIVLLWQPVLVGWETANVSLLLVLGVAAAWRWREKWALVGSIVALLVSIKIFLVPLILWLAFTRRFRACACAVAVTVLVNLVGWAVLGFGQVPVYLHLLQMFTPGAEHRGYSVISLALHLGAGHTVADAIGLGSAAAVIAAALTSAPGARDRVLLLACVLASLLASPLVESHYLALLLVPLALARPRFGFAWTLPILMIVTPPDHPSNAAHAFALAICAIVAGLSVRQRGTGPRRRYRAMSPIVATGA